MNIALIYFILLKNAPGVFLSRFFERKTSGDEPTTREGVRKGPAAEAERDASQHAVGGIARVFFLSSYLFISSSFFFTYVSRPVDSTGPDHQLFFFWKRPGGRLLPYFCSENRPGGAISELFNGTPRGAFTSFFTVLTGFLPSSAVRGVRSLFRNADRFVEYSV